PPHSAGAPCSRGGRKARLSARRPGAENRPLPAPAVRRPLRNARLRARRSADREAGDRDRPAGLYARADAEQQLHHPRRKPEHHHGTDEDVPHPDRLRLHRRDHRRHHSGRPAARHQVRPGPRDGGAQGRQRHQLHSFPAQGCRPPPAGPAHRRSLRGLRRSKARNAHVIELDLQYATSGTAPAEADLRRWCELALRQRSADSELTIRLVDEPEGRELNSTWRQKDYATNVLSFPADVPDGLLDIPLLGDLVICVPVVEREAAEQRKSLQAHWAHLVIHGCLHLLGYDHIDDDEAEEMESLERQLLAELGHPDPYADE